MNGIYSAVFRMSWVRLACALFVLVATCLHGAPSAKRVPAERDALMAQYFRVADLKAPAGVDPQVGAILPLSDGRVAVAFHRGEVAVYDLQKACCKSLQLKQQNKSLTVQVPTYQIN